MHSRSLKSSSPQADSYGTLFGGFKILPWVDERGRVLIISNSLRLFPTKAAETIPLHLLEDPNPIMSRAL